MIGLVCVILLGLWVLWYQPKDFSLENEIPARLTEKLDQLWGIALESLRDKKYLRAEKALLTILRVDKRNASAYNRLGIIYAKQQSYSEAIECFEIAQSLEPSVSSLHNVGLIYYETGNYEKASLAFEQALSLDNTLASRYIAYAKVQEKLGENIKMIDALEQAVRLEPTPQTVAILADALDKAGESERAVRLRGEAAKMIRRREGHKTRMLRQPRRVIH